MLHFVLNVQMAIQTLYLMLSNVHLMEKIRIAVPAEPCLIPVTGKASFFRNCSITYGSPRVASGTINTLLHNLCMVVSVFRHARL